MFSASWALEPAAVRGHGGVAGTDVGVAGGARRDAAAPRAARPARPVAEPLPRRQLAPGGAGGVAV